MKLRLPLALGLLSVLVADSALALDFTLRHQTVGSEGINLSSAYISDGDSKIMLRIPMNWKASDSSTALDLIPTQPNSRVSLSQVKTTQTLPLDAGGRDVLLKQVTAQLPNGAKKVELLPVVDDLVPINHWTSVEFTHRYEFFGQIMRRSVVFINMMPGRVVQMSVVAPEDSFKNVHEEARVMLNHWFEPKLELTPEMARHYEEGYPQG